MYQVMSHANADARIITVGDIDVEPTITVISFPSALRVVQPTDSVTFLMLRSLLFELGAMVGHNSGSVTIRRCTLLLTTYTHVKNLQYCT